MIRPPFRIMPSMLMCLACFSRCICLSFILLRIFTSAASRSCFFQRPLQATTFILCLLVRPDAVRFQVSRGHALTHKFSLPFRIVTGHKLVVTSYADGSGGPLALRTSPLASELPLTCEALPFAAGLAPLTCRAAPVNSSTFAALTTPEGLRSLRSASSRCSSLLAKGK